MRAELKSGKWIEFDKSLIKRMTYQQMSEARYYLVLGNHHEAKQYEITKQSYIDLTREVLIGERQDTQILQAKKGNSRNRRKNGADSIPDE